MRHNNDVPQTDMGEIYLDPVKFQEEIDNYEDTNDEVKQIKYEIDIGSTQLGCVDKYLECIEEFNKLIQKFGELSDLDVETMKSIKSTWMNADESVANKTIGQIVSDWVTSD